MPHLALQIMHHEHTAIAAVLRSLDLLVKHGPGDDPERFFDVLRAMLFYMDEYPERLHHPKESRILFPLLLRAAPELAPVIDRLNADHQAGEAQVRELQHLLLGWELLGEARRQAFEQAAARYVQSQTRHMQEEETRLLPIALKVLGDADWAQLDTAFKAQRLPTGGDMDVPSTDPNYDRLFTRIVMTTPAPLGMGGASGGKPR